MPGFSAEYSGGWPGRPNGREREHPSAVAFALFAAALSAGLLTAQGIYAPSVAALHTADACTGVGCAFNATVAGTLGCIA